MKTTLIRRTLPHRPFAGRAAALAGLAICAAAAATASAAINSNLTIEKGQSFLLGGSQPSAFRVTGTNTGPVAVDVLARSRGDAAAGDQFIATVTPGAAFDQSFARREIAIFRNTSGKRDALVKVRVTGYTADLGMRYEGAQ